MSRQIQEIPPAPRTVRWRAVLWHRWPVAFAGFVLAVYGGLIALMLSYGESGGLSGSDLRLDQEHRTAPAEVTLVTPSQALWDGEATDQVQFRYQDAQGQTGYGQCFAHRGEFQPGQNATVEYSELKPEYSRLRDTRVTLRRVTDLLSHLLCWVVAPGLALLLSWVWCVCRLRGVLCHGDVAVAELTRMRRLRFIIPTMIDVDFLFRDHSATTRAGTHWVRGHSELGRRLAAGPARVAVVHDRTRPTLCRLVIPEDFVAATSRDQPNVNHT